MNALAHGQQSKEEGSARREAAKGPWPAGQFKGKVKVLAVVMAAFAGRIVESQVVTTPRYDAGVSYAGLCTDSEGRVLPHLYSELSAEIVTEQDGLDSCVLTYGADKVIGFSFDDGFEPPEYSCFFAPGDVPEVQPGWGEGRPSEGAQAPVAGGNGDTASRCYDFLAEGCKARVITAVDRTYARRYPRPAMRAALQAYGAAAEFVQALPFDESVRLGLLDLDRTSVWQRVDIDSTAGHDQSLLLESIFVAGATLSAGSRAYGTKFPPIFEEVADALADGSSSTDPSNFIIIVSDGRLLKPDHWRNYVELKQNMLDRLGPRAPKILCYRIERATNTKFFDAVCDETFYEGMDGKSLADVAIDVSSRICEPVDDRRAVTSGAILP
ncbi:Hypothetical Protein FCC1311_096432 [Hondaea fermentalgiana]|uniref:VWFA domain-containing protein n=1 Tax=Hondaea fermentalgiana TaxID=2315210 RepID=A0A2R5GRE7_9STRA|nr:Hypothetical Protein FCC1311_096432 [Hondaea fermentalgiana]|eukprot:GBG33420.1 Hypothetical Protein FCC1311_096432 [Hondaea fermentalgiana]